MKIPKITFVYDRRKKAAASVVGRVELRVTYDYKQKFFATGVAILPKQWDGRNLMVRGHPDAASMNAGLDDLRRRVSDIIRRMGQSIVLDDIPALLAGVEVPDITFPDYIAKRIEARRINEDTKRRYRGWLKVFREWGVMRWWQDITARNIRAYDEWAAKRAGMRGGTVVQGTLYNYHAALRSFINDAVADEYIAANPYNVKRIKIDKGAKRHVDTLTPDQVAKIETLDLSATPSLERVRDAFLLQCYTGLAYTDLRNFRISQGVETDGELIVRGTRQKTGTEYIFMLLPKAKALLDKYGGKAPLPSNVKYNQYLKAVGLMVGYPTLHSHMGRASCATLMRNAGLPMSVIQRVLGHNTITQTERYASMIDATIIEAMKSLI